MNETPKFAELALKPALLQAVKDLGFETPTPIQAEAIPTLLAGRDVIGRARTGSGKTAAFGLPLLQRIEAGKTPRALVLAPTRELAVQVASALEELAKHLRLNILTIYGGASYKAQLQGLSRGAAVVVGTPGRVIDLMDRGSLDLSKVEYFVLDEADEMLRMGFIEDVERILANLPKSRQIALFSATMPPAIRKVAQQYQTDPVHIQVEESALSVDHIEQTFIRVPRRSKPEALLRLIAAHRSEGTLVFARTRAGCAEAAEMLIQNGISADALHGDLNQGARERVLGRLRSKALDVVVATDVAARGLDVEHLTHVINYDLSENAEIYVHRIGRTGRAGREGTAVTLVEPREWRKARLFAKELGIQFEEVRVPTNLQIAESRRSALVDLLEDEMSSEDGESASEWIQAVAKEKGWSLESVAAAAIQLLSQEMEVEFGDEAPEVELQPVVFGDINEVEIVLSVGRRDGIRPADIVGTFTNEMGVPSNQIGRISLGSHRAFVGLPRGIADAMIKTYPAVMIRGKRSNISLNQGASGGGESSERQFKRRNDGDKMAYKGRRKSASSHRKGTKRPSDSTSSRGNDSTSHGKK